jgi:hypothetical protein
VEQFARDPVLKGNREWHGVSERAISRSGVSERAISRSGELEIYYIFGEGDFDDEFTEEKLHEKLDRISATISTQY